MAKPDRQRERGADEAGDGGAGCSLSHWSAQAVVKAAPEVSARIWRKQAAQGGVLCGAVQEGGGGGDGGGGTESHSGRRAPRLTCPDPHWRIALNSPCRSKVFAEGPRVSFVRTVATRAEPPRSSVDANALRHVSRGGHATKPRPLPSGGGNLEHTVAHLVHVPSYRCACTRLATSGPLAELNRNEQLAAQHAAPLLRPCGCAELRALAAVLIASGGWRRRRRKRSGGPPASHVDRTCGSPTGAVATARHSREPQRQMPARRAEGGGAAVAPRPPSRFFCMVWRLAPPPTLAPSPWLLRFSPSAGLPITIAPSEHSLALSAWPTTGPSGAMANRSERLARCAARSVCRRSRHPGHACILGPTLGEDTSSPHDDLLGRQVCWPP